VSIVELYEGQKLLVDISNLLEKFGFIPVDHDLNNDVVSGDALFINSHLIKGLNRISLPEERRVPKVSIKQWFKFSLIKLGIPARKVQSFSSFIRKLFR